MVDQLGPIFGYRDSGYSVVFCIPCKNKSNLYEVNIPLIKNFDLECDQCGQGLGEEQSSGLPSISPSPSLKLVSGMNTPDEGTHHPVGYMIDK